MTATPPVALVTGGARRIGRAITEDLSRNGWAVAIHCHNSRDDAEALAAECRKNGARVAVIEADLDGLFVLIEKDFACTQPRPREDESDMFPNPNAVACG